ncbi:flagellar filament capping protein FliD [Heyndrickxia sp. FSL K6-6286]|uniref:flagellar filament capping protein FliD n=1 Tax=Heyndrickxia sp. FSL K6-6286 TaxID=2921510 RepID=UPI00217F147C|nr:flagellar filament capping protein FliD [Heyndrickxia oleronia]
MVRISGLASGMDIDSIVKDLMKAESLPLNKMKQQKQILEWKRDGYRAINTLFLDFRKSLTNMKLSSQYRVRNAVSTNNDLLSATASSAASMASNTISNVRQLATAASKVNAGTIAGSSSSKIDINKSMYDQQNLFSNWDSSSWKEGSVESARITIQNPSNISIPLNGATSMDTDPSTINIKVNGTSYKVVSGTPQNVNEVSVDSTGKLTFHSSDTKIKSGASIQVDYIADSKTEKTTLKKDAKGWQLSKKNIASVDSIKIGSDSYTLGTNTTGKTYELTGSAGTIGTIDLETGKISFSDPNFIKGDTDIEVKYKENYTTFNIQTFTSKGPISQNFFVQGSDSLNAVMNKVNSSSVGVTMFYDSFSDRLTLTRNEKGNFNGKSANTLDANGELIKDPSYGINDYEINTSGSFIDNVLQFAGVSETGGENAIFDINGLQTERNSNTFESNGITYTLKQTFKDPVTVSINNDNDKIFDNIKAFIDQYNTLIDTVNNTLNEERFRDYKPLTDDEREQLSDKQQEQWEEKAKSGLLKGDNILSSALSQMRTLFYQPVENSSVSEAYNQLAKIGIKTTSNYYEGGKLEINEAALRKAIEDDPGSVEKLFTSTGSTDSSKGIINRLYDNVTTTIDKLNARAGKSYSTNQQFTIGKDLDRIGKQITSFQSRLTQIEDRYYRQFTAMEKAIQKSNSQMTYLLQQFGGGQ